MPASIAPRPIASAPRLRPLALVVLWTVCSGLSGCLTGVLGTESQPRATAEPEPPAAGEPFDAADARLLEELRVAWADRDVLVTQRLCAILEARSEDPRVDAVLADYAARIDGLLLSRALELRLDARADPDDPTRTQVSLLAQNRGDRGVQLHLLTPTLERRVVSVTALGLESRSREDRLVGEFEPLELPAGSSAERVLDGFVQVGAGALATRDSFTLDPAGVWLTDGDRLLPVDELGIAGDSRTGIAPFLPPTPLAPHHVADYAGDPAGADLPDEVYLPALLERAVRVAPRDRAAAVALLAERIPDWTDDQVRRAAPALRWLTGRYGPGSDPRTWRAYLARTDGGVDALPNPAAPRSKLVLGDGAR